MVHRRINPGFTTTGLVLAFWMLIGLGAAFGEDQEQKDPIFGGQILSLTEPKEELEPSGDPRFRDNNDGTVSDLEQNLMWKQQDSYQEKKIWINWEGAQDYLREANENRFAGYDDWRLPTRKELLTLYEENKSVSWKYYWTSNEVHIDPIFGNTSCCFWTSESHKEDYAWGVNFIRGKPYLSLKAGQSLSLTVIRLVREEKPGARPAGNKSQAAESAKAD